jgi:hypothetical protein
VVGSCKQNKETWCTIIGEEFLEQMDDYKLLKDCDPCI